MPINAAAKQPAGKLPARARRKTPSAVSKLIPRATRGPKKRSSSQPTTTLPSRLDPPSTDAHKAAVLGVIPRSVSNVKRCVMAPFMLMELTNKIAVTIQKDLVATLIRNEPPEPPCDRSLAPGCSANSVANLAAGRGLPV